MGTSTLNLGARGCQNCSKCFIFVSIYGPLAGAFPPRKARLGTLFAPAAFCPQTKRAKIKLFALICFRPQTKTSVRLKVDQSSKEGASKQFGATSGQSSRAVVWEKFSRTKSGGRGKVQGEGRDMYKSHGGLTQDQRQHIRLAGPA